MACDRFGAAPPRAQHVGHVVGGISVVKVVLTGVSYVWEQGSEHVAHRGIEALLFRLQVKRSSQGDVQARSLGLGGADVLLQRTWPYAGSIQQR